MQFARTARALTSAAHGLGLMSPTFRSPPRAHAVRRTIRRRPDGVPTVSIAVRGRPWPAVVADMVDGVVLANDVDDAAAGQLRDALWAAIDQEVLYTTGSDPTPVAAATGRIDRRSTRPGAAAGDVRPRPRPARAAGRETGRPVRAA